MTKGLVLGLPAQHANRAHDAQLSETDRTLVELAQETLLVFGKQLADGALSFGDLVDFVALLQSREGCRADHMVADPIGLQLEAFQSLPVFWDGRRFHRAELDGGIVGVALDESGAQNDSCLEQIEIRRVKEVDEPDIRLVLLNRHRAFRKKLLVGADRELDLDCIHRGHRGCVHSPAPFRATNEDPIPGARASLAAQLWLDRLGDLLEGFRRVVHLALGVGLLDLGHPLLELFHLGREIFRRQGFAALRPCMNHELCEQEQADIVVGALVAGLERLVDDVQEPQQVDEEEGQKADGHQRLEQAAHIGEQQDQQNDGDDARDHRLGRGQELLALDVVHPQRRLAQRGLLRAQPDDVVRRYVGPFHLLQRLREVLDRRLALPRVAAGNIAAQRRDDGDHACPGRLHVGLAPDPVHRLGFPQQGIEARSDVGRGPLGVAVVDQRAGDHKAHDEDAAADHAGDQRSGRHAGHPDRPEQGSEADQDHDDHRGLDSNAITTQDFTHGPPLSKTTVAKVTPHVGSRPQLSGLRQSGNNASSCPRRPASATDAATGEAA